jgi:hypothetical protein
MSLRITACMIVAASALIALLGWPRGAIAMLVFAAALLFAGGRRVAVAAAIAMTIATTGVNPSDQPRPRPHGGGMHGR